MNRQQDVIFKNQQILKSYCIGCAHNGNCQDKCKEYEYIKRLLDKSTPVEPIKIKTDYTEANICRICLKVFEGFPYCRNCGQAFVTKEEN